MLSDLTALFREGKPEQLITAVANSHPLKRLGTVDDIAPVVAFLASPEAAWVNGQNILVNGVSVYVPCPMQKDFELRWLILS